jgi:hypothetical protein
LPYYINLGLKGEKTLKGRRGEALKCTTFFRKLARLCNDVRSYFIRFGFTRNKLLILIDDENKETCREVF